jgi:hypothetical protein
MCLIASSKIGVTCSSIHCRMLSGESAGCTTADVLIDLAGMVVPDSSIVDCGIEASAKAWIYGD